MKSDDLKSLFYIALAAGAAYAAWYLYQSLTKVGAAVGNAASAAGAAVVNAQQGAASSVADAAQSIFGTGIAQPGETYTVTMADGSVQTVQQGQLPISVQGAGLQGYRRRIRRER